MKYSKEVALLVSLFSIISCQQSLNVTMAEFECVQDMATINQNFSVHCSPDVLAIEVNVS